MSEIENKTPEVPAYLQCEPRTYEVKLNDTHEFTCELNFTVIIKCTDEMLHEHNNFWSGHKYRLQENNGDIVSVILKLVGRKLFWVCYENGFRVHRFSESDNKIFEEDGWSSNCFEITKLYFESFVDEDDFEIKPVQVEK